MAQKGKWKVRLLIGFVLLFAFVSLAALTPWGREMAKNHIKSAYESMPPEQRRDSAYADAWLFLAWWSGGVLGDTKEAMSMYRSFLGYEEQDVNGQKVTFAQTLKLKGLCSEDGMTGWGPFHKRAPEAFFNYIDLHATEKSWSVTREEVFNYYRLFYQWAPYYGEKRIPDCFRRYWEKMQLMYMHQNLNYPQDFERSIPAAPASPEDC
jgi:hypothetical protein